MRLCCLVAIVEALDRAIRQREEWNIPDKARIDAMAGKIKRGNGRHQARQLSSSDLNAASSSWRPMKTRRLSCFSLSFQAR